RVHAVFFWVGYRIEHAGAAAERRRALVARAIDEGHLIGNHTVDHLHLCHRDIADQAAAREIDHNRELYEGTSRFPIALFRTPYGDHCDRVIEMLAARGLTHVHWDIDAQEYFGRTGQSTADYIIGHLRRLHGRAVVLMHDIQPATAHALPL